MIFFKSVKFYLTLWYAFILFCLLSIFAFFMHTELSRALHQDADRTLAHEALTLELSLISHLKPILGNSLPSRSQKISEETREDIYGRLVDSIALWEKTNKQITRSTLMIRLISMRHELLKFNLKGWEQEIIFPDFERDSLFMESGESYQTIHFTKKPIRLYYRQLKIQGFPLLVIQCGRSLEEVQKTLHRLFLIILFSIPGAVGAAGAAGWFLAKRAFRPLDLMINQARNISAAHLEVRLPRTQSGDELDRLAETLNEMMDRIESSTRAVRDFSSDISHELKTPLAVIRGEIDVAMRRKRSEEELENTLKVIGGEVNELIRLVDDLLFLVRSDAKQLRFEKNPLSLKELLLNTANHFKDRARSQSIEFSLEMNEDAVVAGDSIYLKRLFINLLDNAFKFTPEKGKIALSLNREAQQAVITVKDSGIGIPPALQSKVFSRFYRTDQARSYEGSGLGLNIAKTVCDAHAGHISIASQENRGTEVQVRLPLS